MRARACFCVGVRECVRACACVHVNKIIIMISCLALLDGLYIFEIPFHPGLFRVCLRLFWHGLVFTVIQNM